MGIEGKSFSYTVGSYLAWFNLVAQVSVTDKITFSLLWLTMSSPTMFGLYYLTALHLFNLFLAAGNISCTEASSSCSKLLQIVKSNQIKSNHWFIVPFAVRRLNCRVPYKL